MKLAYWTGVDLDATLATYDRWRGTEHIGEPIAPMVARVRAWLAAGQTVKIFTARVSRQSCIVNDITVEEAMRPIEAWCLQHIGTVLPVTCEKDMAMISLWDDRAVQVEPNTGRRVDGFDSCS